MVTYLMLTGRLPFQGKHYLNSDGLVFQDESWKQRPEFAALSAPARDFVSRQLRIHGEDRMSSVEAWHHPFLKEHVQTLRLNGIDLSSCAPCQRVSLVMGAAGSSSFMDVDVDDM